LFIHIVENTRSPGQLLLSVDRMIGWLSGTVFLLAAVGNASIALRWYFRSKRGSPIPLFGGLAGIVAYFTLPFAALRRW